MNAATKGNGAASTAKDPFDKLLVSDKELLRDAFALADVGDTDGTVGIVGDAIGAVVADLDGVWGLADALGSQKICANIFNAQSRLRAIEKLYRREHEHYEIALRKALQDNLELKVLLEKHHEEDEDEEEDGDDESTPPSSAAKEPLSARDRAFHILDEHKVLGLPLEHRHDATIDGQPLGEMLSYLSNTTSDITDGFIDQVVDDLELLWFAVNDNWNDLDQHSVARKLETFRQQLRVAGSLNRRYREGLVDRIAAALEGGAT